jgi:hypothetical protein
MRDRDIQVELVAFGKEVQFFLQEDRIGVYLLDCAKAEMADAAFELANVNPAETAKVMELQIKYRVADSVQQWLAHAIQRGMEARTIIDQEEGTH